MPKAEPPVRRVYPGKGGQGRSHFRVTPTGLAIIKKLAANGCKLDTIAAALGCSRDTLAACRSRDVAVQEALDAGRAAMHDELVGLLMAQARAGAFIPAIFLLKSVFGYREGAQLEVSVDLGGVLVVPADITVEEYLRRKAEAGEIEPMRDVTPRLPQTQPALYPGHAIDHAPVPEAQPAPEPAPRSVPSGTVIAPFPGPRVKRGD